MHFQNCAQGLIFPCKNIINKRNAELFNFWRVIEHSTFDTDIDPECGFMESTSGDTSIDASPGSDFRKPSPGSRHDSSYV